MLVVSTPTVVRLSGLELRRKDIEAFLSYIDEKVDYEIRKLKQSSWFVAKFGEEAFQEKLTHLATLRKKSLLFEDQAGLWTYSGISGKLADYLGDQVDLKLIRPPAKSIPWARVPLKQPRYYQVTACQKLLEVGHGAVEIGTGLGKSLLALMICKELALKTVIMSPSLNIAQQLYDDFCLHFGKRYVGFFGNGKKQSNKLFTIGIAASLTRLRPGDSGYTDLSKAQVFIADESHMCPAKTLSEVCFGLVKSAPYRFFLSGTQMRGDGKGLLLDAIMGPIVYRMTVKEGVDQGFLAAPAFCMVHLDSQFSDTGGEANAQTRRHLFYDPRVSRVAGGLANQAAGLLLRPTVILVEEIEQFAMLLPHLKHRVRFAHGPLNKLQRDLIPPEYHESDPKALVESFNRGEYPILVGTSCITLGTNIEAVQCILFLRGGRSEVEVKQAVGRGTRLSPGKTDCLFFDFWVDNIPTLARHAKARQRFYDEIYPSYKELHLDSRRQ